MLTPVGARNVPFSMFVQNGPGEKPASYKIGTGEILLLKGPGHGVDHSHQSEARLRMSRARFFCACMACYGETFIVI
jgi:hypothetical protein